MEEEKKIPGARQDKPYQSVVFVAEDMPRSMQTICNILARENFKIAAAGDGVRALQMIPVVKPDLVLLDIMMPEKNGFEVCQELKKNPETKDIPIIFITAKSDSDDIIKGLKAGAVDYVCKPFNSEELLCRVKAHLEMSGVNKSRRLLKDTCGHLLSKISDQIKMPLVESADLIDSLKDNYDSTDDVEKKVLIEKIYQRTHQTVKGLEPLMECLRTFD